MQLQEVVYKKLTGKQKENYNYAQLSAKLADLGLLTTRLHDDWEDADFIARHINKGLTLRVQLKSRLTFDKKYFGKRLWIAFPSKGDWFLFPHDKVFQSVNKKGTILRGTRSWKLRKRYSAGRVSKKVMPFLEKYKIRPGLKVS